MADPYESYSFDGNDFSVTADYGFIFPYAESFGVSGTVTMQARRSIEPQVMSVSRDGRTIPIEIFNRDPANLTAATFRSNIKKWFTNAKNTSVRYLVFYGDDGSTLVRAPVYVESLEPIYETDQHYRAVLVMAQPWFEANSATVSAANPATVTNAGNVATRPSIALTQTTHKTLRACTVVAATGYGFTGMPVRFALSDSAATSSNVFVFVNGASVPCYVTGSGGASSAVWAICDAASDGTPTYVDIIYGSGLSNPLCQTLSDFGMLSTSGSLNTAWLWTDWTITQHPDVAGAWVPSRTAYDGGGMTYQLTSDGGSVVFDVGAVGGAGMFGVTDYDGMTVRVPTGADSTSTSIDSFSRTTSGFAGVQSQAFVRARFRGQDRWTTLWSTRANATVTTDIAFTDGAIVFSAGIENDGSSGDPATVTFTDSGLSGTRIDLVAATDVTVTVGSATNVDYYNGTLVVGNYTLTFTNCFAPDGTLTIDCQDKSIISSASGAIYNWPRFSDPDIWASLEPGANTITDGLSAADTWTHRDAFE